MLYICNRWNRSTAWPLSRCVRNSADIPFSSPPVNLNHGVLRRTRRKLGLFAKVIMRIGFVYTLIIHESIFVFQNLIGSVCHSSAGYYVTGCDLESIVNYVVSSINSLFEATNMFDDFQPRVCSLY